MNPHLFHLASPALPVGAFSYSQGLEWAVESGDVKDEQTACQWIQDTLTLTPACCEVPAVIALLRAFYQQDHTLIARLNAEFIASRETAELRAETLQMGYSLARLLRDLSQNTWHIAEQLDEISYPTAWAAMAAYWQITDIEAAHTYLWSYLENQVMAAVKLVPLGQTAGQRILCQLGPQLPQLVQAAIQRAEHPLNTAWDNFTPRLTLASCLHETQYTRLFRS